MNDFFAVISPRRCRRAGSCWTGLGRRRLLRWQVIREIRPKVADSGLVVTAYEHHSFHWTAVAAYRAAHRARNLQREAGHA